MPPTSWDRSGPCYRDGVHRVVTFAFALAAGSPARADSPPPLVDLSASLAPLAHELGAHPGEARFIALLSPT